MKPLPEIWKPLRLEDLSGICGKFKNWILCGGHSVAVYTGSDTREHGDVDIGVFRSELNECLSAIGPDVVYLCVNGGHVAWNGDLVPESVHDIWVCDKERNNWILQIMVYDDDGDLVFYRRDRSISWSKESHSIPVGDIRILNPFITFLFKSNRKGLEAKEKHDLMKLIETKAEQGAAPNP